MFKALVVALLSVIAAGVVYLAVRETPGEKVLRAADELVAPRATTRAAEARQTTARADSSNLFQALKLYKLDTKRYPTEAEGLAVLVAGSPRPYLDKLPTDPWGHPTSTPILEPAVSSKFSAWARTGKQTPRTTLAHGSRSVRMAP
jgi:type II secretion system protein G